MTTAVQSKTAGVPAANSTVYRILLSISLVHLLNDSIQSVVPAIFPILKDSMQLTYTQLGIIAFVLNVTASMMQPVIGLASDRRPMPYLLPIGMTSTLLGMLGLALAPHYSVVLLSVVLVGFGSAVFHPEGSRVAHLAAGERRGLAQSIFQVGGNSGQTLAPILTALLFVPLGQFGAIWFTLVALLAVVILWRISRWYQETLRSHPKPAKPKKAATAAESSVRRGRVAFVLTLLILIMFSKFWYTAGITNYYPFYLIEHFGVSIERSQIYIFVFLVTGAIGTFLGGPIADRVGRRNLIWISILGSLPFAVLIPYVNLFWAYILLGITGLFLLSSWSVMIVYAQELLPGKVGTVSGLFFGLSFGLGGLGSIALGGLGDLTGIGFVIQLCGWLPLLGVVTLLLPSDAKLKQWAAESGA